MIDFRVGPIRDSLVGIAFVLALMAESGKTIGQLVDEIGGYYMQKEKFIANKTQAQQIIEAAKEQFSNARFDKTDGCRFDMNDGWLHLRSSNTEPVMRAIVEAKEQHTVQKYIDAILGIRDKIIS